MLRAAVFIRKHDETEFHCVVGPGEPVAKSREAFKEAARLREHREIAEVQFWQSDCGVVKERKLRKPAAMADSAQAPAHEPAPDPAPEASTKPAPEAPLKPRKK